MFLKIIEWHIGIETNYSVTFGKSGKNMQAHISKLFYDKVLSTYPDAKAENIWNALFTLTEVFSELATKIAFTLNFKYNSDEDRNVMNYLNRVYSLTK